MRPKEVGAGLAELVLGASCSGCGAAGPGACGSCQAAVAGSRPFRVSGLVDPATPVVAAGDYADRLRRLLLAAKERGGLGLLPLLGGRLALAVAALVLEQDLGGQLILVPVPSARAQVAARGVDLTGSLARIAARRLRATGLAATYRRGLVQVRRPLDQAGLDRNRRLANLAGAFAVSGQLGVGQLVVIDDIVTTGSTLAEAVRACRAAGQAVAGAAVVAATRREGGAR